MNFNPEVADQINSLPTSSGVYLFKNKSGNVLYVGKAKDLKKRVSSYIRQDFVDWKIDRLKEETVFLDFKKTSNELGALILEAKLIEALQPPLNISLKNKNPFLFFSFSNEKISKFELTRSTKKDGSYFGPFFNKFVARELFNLLNKVFGLRRCNRKIAGGCLYYHLGQCGGFCLEQFNEDEYLSKIELVKLFFKNGPKKFIHQLSKNIDKLNSELKFEEASVLFKYKLFLKQSKFDLENATSATKLFLEKEHVQHIWFFDENNGIIMLLENKHQHLTKKELFLKSELGELIFDEILCQFYRENPPPLIIFINFELVDKALIQSFLKNWHNQTDDQEIITFSKREDNPTFLDLALEINQKEIFSFLNLSKELQRFFETTHEIRTIDCFDVSHHQELFIVASCVRFNNGKPDKSFYRQFKIKSTKTPNDYKSLAEAVYRRYSGEDRTNLPDLVLIDGGKGQLGAVKNLFPNLTFASLAKREERIFFANSGLNKKDGIVLNRLDMVGLLLINIRNHAHRFAIRFHRQLKNSNLN